MAKINIDLKSAAETLGARSTKGTVMLILQDTAVGGVHTYNRSKVVKENYSTENKAFIDKCLDKKYRVNRLRVVCYNPDNSVTLDNALDLIDGVKFNYLAAPYVTEDSDKKKIVDFIKTQVNNKNYTVKACLNNYAAADYENVMSNCIENITIDGEEMTGNEFTVDHACLCAKSATKGGLSLKIIKGVSKVKLISDNDADSIADNGEVGIVYDNDFEAYVLTDDVTTKTTIDDSTESKLLKDRRVSEILSMMQDDIKLDWKTNWYDKYGGSYSNRKLYVDHINSSYLATLGRTGELNGDMVNQVTLSVEKTRDYLEETLKIDTTDMEDEDILSYDIGNKLFAVARVYVLQNMKELDFTINY